MGMTVIKIYGKKGMIEAKPFQINSVDIDPELTSEEEQIINYAASDSDNQEESEVAENTGN